MNKLGLIPTAKTEFQRRYDLDWLKVFAVLLLFYFHTAAVFYTGELGEFYIKNKSSSIGINYFVLFVHQWHMPLLFFLSGSATWFTLSFRTAGEYITERFKRLFIPFLFGTLVIIPPQVYYRLLSNSDYQNSYTQFYPQFFNGIRPQGNFEWGHLWFIIYLFVFSLIGLPLFVYLKQQAIKDLIPKLTILLEKPGAIFLLALPLAIIEGSLRPKWLGFQNLYNDWANFFLYFFYFIYGYVICADPKFGEAIDKQLKIALIMAVASMSVFLELWASDIIPNRGYSLGYILYQIFRGVNSWLWIVALLGLARKYLNFNNSLLQYATQASYPFYILHQTILVAIAFYVVRWNITITAKFFIISTASLIATIVVYEVLVKRHNVARFLFGLKLIN